MYFKITDGTYTMIGILEKEIDFSQYTNKHIFNLNNIKLALVQNNLFDFELIRNKNFMVFENHSGFNISKISEVEFSNTFKTLINTKYIKHHYIPQDYDLSGLSTPKKIIFIPSRGKEYEKILISRNIYIGPISGSVTVDEEHYFPREEKIIEPEIQIGDFRFCEEESTVLESIYYLTYKDINYKNLI